MSKVYVLHLTYLKFRSNSFSLEKTIRESPKNKRNIHRSKKPFLPFLPSTILFGRRKQLLSRTFLFFFPFLSPSPGSRDGSRLPPGDTRKRPVPVPARASPSRSSQITKGIGNGFISPPFLILLHA